MVFHGEEVDGEDPADERLRLVGEAHRREEEAEQALAPVVVEEAEVVHDLVHTQLRQDDDQPEEKVVQIYYRLVDGRRVHRGKPQNGYDD